MRMQQRDKCTEANATPAWVRTESLYMPTRRKADAMTVAELRRGLCAKSAGDWHVCEHCGGGCSFGRQLTAIMRGEVEEPKLPEAEKPLTVLPPVPECKPVDKRMRYAPEKWKEIIRGIQAMVQAGTSFKAACRAHGMRDTQVRQHMKAHGYTVPRNPNAEEEWKLTRKASEAARTEKAIQTAARALLALEQGMTKAKAAKAGGYARWRSVTAIQRKYPQKLAETLEALRR